MTLEPPLHRESLAPVDVGTHDLVCHRRIITLSLIVLAATVAYLTFDVEASWDYALDLRGRQLGALVVVGISVGVSSLAFQTIAGSRILTPSVMGFDALYVLLQTFVVFVLGSATLQLMDAVTRFVLTTTTLCAFGLMLFGWLFRRHSRNLFVLVLVGIVLGSLFASLSTFASRLLSPDDFLTLQTVLFASFNTVDGQMLVVTAVATALAVAALVPLLRTLDVVALGRDHSIGLGVSYHAVVRAVLVLVTVLVATATALVGPMLFLGLLVANLARQLIPTHRHILLVPAAALVGVASTVIGQLLVVHLFGWATTLSVVINLIGGLYFIVLLLKATRL